MGTQRFIAIAGSHRDHADQDVQALINSDE